MPRFEVRERTTYDVVDTETKPNDAVGRKAWKDARIMLNTADRKEAERFAKQHEKIYATED